VGFGLVLVFCNLGLFGCCLLLKSVVCAFLRGSAGLCCGLAVIFDYPPLFILSTFAGVACLCFRRFFRETANSSGACAEPHKLLFAIAGGFCAKPRTDNLFSSGFCVDWLNIRFRLPVHWALTE
jgi:hypothetical protein